MTREEKLQKAHQMFDNRNLLTELKWQREYFKRGYISNQEELFNLWIFDECIKALEQEPVIDKLRAEIEEPLKINQGLNTESAKAQAIALSWVLEVIDKYKADRSEEDGNNNR